MSLDRLEIRYGGGRRLLISPKDREGFLEAVVARSRLPCHGCRSGAGAILAFLDDLDRWHRGRGW